MSGCVLEHDQHTEATDGLLCRRHSQRLLDTLTDIRELWFELALILEAGSAPKEASPKTRRLKADSPPAPANLDALVLRDHRTIQKGHTDPPSLPAIIASWVLLVADERPLTTTLPNSVVGQLDLLTRHHQWITGQEWIEDYQREMTELRKALKSAVRDQTHREYGKCPHCNGPVFIRNGSNNAKCSGCNATWSTPQELARLSVMREQA